MKEETQFNKTEYEDLYNITITKKIKQHHKKIINLILNIQVKQNYF